MTAAECAAAEERAHICERCHQQLGTGFFDRRWVCLACRRLLEWRLAYEEYQVSPGFQD